MPEESYVLYIDDERPAIELVGETLQSSGFTVLGVTTGAAGLDAMRKRKPALLLLDLVLPDLSGVELYRQMKLDENLTDIPVIVVSGKIPHSTRTLLADLPPVHDCLVKPFDLEHLLRSVRQVVFNHLPAQ